MHALPTSLREPEKTEKISPLIYRAAQLVERGWVKMVYYVAPCFCGEPGCRRHFAYNRSIFEAVAFCASGAIYRAVAELTHLHKSLPNDPRHHLIADPRSRKLLEMIGAVIRDELPMDFKSLENFNDGPETTKYDVLNLLHRAARRAEQLEAQAKYFLLRYAPEPVIGAYGQPMLSEDCALDNPFIPVAYLVKIDKTLTELVPYLPYPQPNKADKEAIDKIIEEAHEHETEAELVGV